MGDPSGKVVVGQEEIDSMNSDSRKNGLLDEDDDIFKSAVEVRGLFTRIKILKHFTFDYLCRLWPQSIFV